MRSLFGGGGGGWSGGGGGGWSGGGGGGGFSGRRRELAGAVAPEEAGSAMKLKDFLTQLEHDKIVAAIGVAEAKTSGEIRVFLG